MTFDLAISQDIIYLIFSVTFGLYYVSLIEKWPKIGRFSEVSTEPDSAKIMGIAYSLILIILYFTLKVMSTYFGHISKGITDDLSLFLFVVTLISFLLIPKGLAGLIRGVIMMVIPDDFQKAVISCDADQTQNELFLIKDTIKKYNLYDKTNIKSYGRKKTVGNFFLLLAFLTIPYFGPNLNYQLFPAIFLIVALVLPNTQFF